MGDPFRKAPLDSATFYINLPETAHAYDGEMRTLPNKSKEAKAAGPPVHTQGQAGVDNHIMLAAIDVLAAPYQGGSIPFVTNIAPLLPNGQPEPSLEVSISASTTSTGPGTYNVVWTATNASLDGAPLLYRIDIAVLVEEEQQVLLQGLSHLAAACFMLGGPLSGWAHKNVLDEPLTAQKLCMWP